MNPDTIRTHPQHDQIVQDLAAGHSLRTVAEKYGVSKSALERFKNSPTGTLKENTMTTPATENTAPQTAEQARTALELAQANLAKLEQAERENALLDAQNRNRAELENLDTLEGAYRTAVFAELERLAGLKAKANAAIDAAIKKLSQAATELAAVAASQGPTIIGLDKAIANSILPALDAKASFWGNPLTPEVQSVFDEAQTRGINFASLKRPWVNMSQQYTYNFQDLPAGLTGTLPEHAQAILKAVVVDLIGATIPLNLPEKPAAVIAPTPEPVFVLNLELTAKVQRALDLNIVSQASRAALLRLLEQITDSALSVETRNAAQNKLEAKTSDIVSTW